MSKLGRDLHNVIIIDNSPASYIFHPENAVSFFFSYVFMFLEQSRQDLSLYFNISDVILFILGEDTKSVEHIGFPLNTLSSHPNLAFRIYELVP